MKSEDLTAFFIKNDQELKKRVLTAIETNDDEVIGPSLVNELYLVYENCLIKENNLEKEIVFVQFLIRFTALLLRNDSLSVFVKRAIKCCVDSAGFDLKLCQLSREFVVGLVAYKDQDDIVLTHLLDIFVGKNSVLGVIQEDESTQIYEERMRFIRSNCESLIIDVIDHSSSVKFFNKLGDLVLHKESRLKSLDILNSVLLRCQVIDYLYLEGTKLFENLLNCLCFDESTVELNLATSCLTLILPGICENLPSHLNRILGIYTRLVTLTLDADEDATPRVEISNPMESQWDKLNNLPNEELIEINYSKLLYFVYGLYPLSLLSFFKNPNQYLKQLPLSQLNSLLSDPRYDFFEVKSISLRILSNCKLHPNFTQFNSPDEELKDTLRWKQTGSSKDIASMCLEYVIQPTSEKDSKVTPSELTQLMETHKQLYTTRNSFTSYDSSEEHSRTSFESYNSENNPANIEFYRRELLLLRNDLNFNIYLKDLNEKKLKDVLEMYQNAIKNENLLENWISNSKNANYQNQQLHKSFEQLKEEHRRFKNDRINYENILISKNKALKSSNDENKLEIKNLNLTNQQLLKQIEDLKSVVDPKEIEINELKFNLRNLEDKLNKCNQLLEKNSVAFNGDSEILSNPTLNSKMSLDDLTTTFANANISQTSEK